MTDTPARYFGPKWLDAFSIEPTIHDGPLEDQLQRLLQGHPEGLLWRLLAEIASWAGKQRARHRPNDVDLVRAYKLVLEDAHEEMRGTGEAADEAASLVAALDRKAKQIAKAQMCEPDDLPF